MIVGSIWYGPLFGKLWMEGMGFDPNNQDFKAKMKKSAGPAYGQMFVLALLEAFVLAHIIWAFRTALPPMSDLASGLQGGLWCWLGFILPIKYGDKLWGGKKFKYVAIDLAYYLVVALIMGSVISFWK